METKRTRQRFSKKLILLFVALSGVAYLLPSSLTIDFSALVLTVSTFLFAVLTGFFISRQSTRYNQIREQLAIFDGNISAIYRDMEAFRDGGWQDKAAEIIKAHYVKIIETGEWDYHFVNRSTTITDLSRLVLQAAGDRVLPSGLHLTVQEMIARSDDLQVSRKSMIALEVERMPRFQWLLTYYLAFLLVISIMLIPTPTVILDALLQGAFATLVIFVVILLRQLDNLELFEGMIGTASVEDVLSILEGTR